MSAWVILGRLVLAALCSGLIGLERETQRKAAGLRTHVLVGVGASMFTIVSIVGFEGGDESRVAAQIVTGIGFLGAGAIFREGVTVKGLTTAAGLWTVAAVGLGAGAGAYVLTLFGSAVVLVVLLGLRVGDEIVARRTAVARDQIEVRLDDTRRLQAVLEFVRNIDDDVTQLSFTRTGERGGLLTIAVAPDLAEMTAAMLSAHKHVTGVELLSPLFWKKDRRD